MSLPTLHWKKLPTTPVSTISVAGVLDAAYTALTSTTYYDGTTRTPGSGSAHTVERYQSSSLTQAIYGTPPTNPMSTKWIFAGAITGSYNPPMGNSNTFSVNRLYSGLAKSAGTFSSWDSPTPFTTGSFTGYALFKSDNVSGSSYNPVNLHIYECEEAICISMEFLGATANIVLSIMGAIIDPASTNVLDCEADGRVYCIVCPTAASYVVGMWSSGMFTNSSGTRTFQKFNYGLGTTSPLQVMDNSITTSTLTMPSGRMAYATPLIISSDTSTIIGKLRDIKIVNNMVTNIILTNSGSTVAYTIASSTTSQDNAMALMA